MAKIYVLDDSFSVCMAIERMLATRGHHVVQERLGKAAMANVVQEAPDLMICDFVLPDTDGLEVCTFVKTSGDLAHVPVVVISGSGGDGLRRRVKAAGGDALLRKPFDGEDLLRLIDELLQHRLPDTDTSRHWLEQALDPLAALVAIAFAGVVDRAGRLLASRARGPSVARIASEDIAIVLHAARALGRASRLGTAVSCTFELESGIALVRRIDAEHHLVLVLDDPIAFGKARHLAARLRGQLARVLGSDLGWSVNASGVVPRPSGSRPQAASRSQHAG